VAKKIDSKIQTSERFVKEQENNLFDVMPTVWRNLSIEMRHNVITTIDQFIASTPEGETAWSPDNVRKLLRYCSLDDVTMIWASYMMAKIDPCIIIGIDSEKATNNAAAKMTAEMMEPFKMAVLLPTPLLSEFKERWGDERTQVKLFKHATNFVACRYWKKSSTPLLPSTYLDLSYTDDQVNLLMTSTKDVVHSSIIENAMGEGAKKKIARHHISMFEGNIASYPRLVNPKEQLQSMEELNALTSVWGEIRADGVQEVAQQAAARSAEAEERDKRRRLAAEAAQTLKASLLPTMIEDVEAAVANETSLLNLSISHLKDLLNFFWTSNSRIVQDEKRWAYCSGERTFADLHATI
jgi:hypothetical protein